MIDLSIDFSEIKKLEQKLNKSKSSLPKKFKQTLQKVDGIVRVAYKQQFATEGKEFGKPWKPLTLGTQKDRKRKGFSPKHPILVRTGKLRGKVLGAKKTLSKRELKLTAKIRPRKRKIIKEGNPPYVSARYWARINSCFEKMIRDIKRKMER